MIFKINYDMYGSNIDLKDLMNNKLFCTFTSGEELETLIENISHSYTIMYNKMFVLFVKSNAGSGEVFVKIRNGQELDELHDVQITSPVDRASLY